MNIYEKMLAATDRIYKVAKNLKVGVGQNQYNAVGEADVLEAVKPIEIELGIYSYPVGRRIIESNVYTTESEFQGKKTEKNTYFLRIETIYRFVNIEKPEEFIEVVSYGDGVDPQDKAPGKAITYSDKYALLKAYKIITGDDPDQAPSGTLRNNNHTKRQQKADTAIDSFKPMTEEQIAAFDALDIDINNVATYFKVKPELVSCDLAQKAIDMKRGIVR